MTATARADAYEALSRRDFRRAHRLALGLLGDDPESADGHFVLGMIALEHRNVGKALPLLSNATTLEPSNAAFLAQKARALSLLRRTDEVRETAAKALARQPDDALTLDTLGVALTRIDAHAAAREPLARAVELAPDNPQFQFNLGSCLQFLGEFDAAAAAYRRAVELDPTFHRARWTLSDLVTATPDDNRIDELCALLDAATDANDRLYLGHALAKELEDVGRHDDVIPTLTTAKTAKRASIDYNFAADRALFDALHEVCDQTFVNKTAVNDNREAIFVVGMPRTGTTLVERMLSNHPNVDSAGELNHFGLLAKRAAKTASRSVLDADTARAFPTIDADRLGRDYLERARAHAAGADRFIDKMPLNVLYAGLIHRALPAAKIVCLRRNPMDTCLSNYRQLFATEFSYYNYAYDLIDTAHYYAGFDRLVRHWRDMLGEHFIEVRYEDVVAQPEREARRLLDALGLDWSEAVVRPETNVAPVATASAAQVRERIYSRAVGRWRRYGETTEPLAEALTALGIDIDEPATPPPEPE